MIRAAIRTVIGAANRRAAAFVALAGALLIAISLWHLEGARAGIEIRTTSVDGIPVTVHRTPGAPPGPPVVIAHGFAGSRQIMQSFALALARNGYTAFSFDFQGHGRNPRPLGGDVTDARGATENLLEDMAKIAGFARASTGHGDIATLGHSMASDIVIRFAARDPGVRATIAVSMFSPALSADSPANLLVVVGALESARLKREGLRAVELAHPAALVRPGVTFGRFDDGSARRVVFAPGAEHVGVLFAEASLHESVAWLDRAFGRDGPVSVVLRGYWIAALILGVGLLAWPMARLLPRVSNPPLGAGLGWKRLAIVIGVPAVLTPLMLWRAPTDFLAMLVGDYLVAHFAVFGALQLLCLWRLSGPPRLHSSRLHTPPVPLIAALVLTTGYGLGAIALALDLYFTSFVPTGDRAVLAALMAAATLTYFATDEWAVRGGLRDWPRLLASRGTFLLSLMAAVALNPEDLFFLIILIPMILVFFLLYGVLASVAYRRTGHPLVGAAVSAVALAWAVASVFPILADG